MFYRLASLGLLLAAMALGGFAAFDYFGSAVDTEAIAADEDVVVSGVVAGQDTPVSLRLENRSNHAVRLLGASVC